MPIYRQIYNNLFSKTGFLQARFIRKTKILLVPFLLLVLFFKFVSVPQVYADNGYRFLITATNPSNGATNIPINIQTGATGQSCSTQNNYAVCTILIGLGISPSNPKSGIGYPIIDESSINSNSIVISSPNDSGINAHYQGKQECGGCGDFYHSFTISFVVSDQTETLLKPNSTYTITLKSGENGLKAYYDSSFQKYYAYLEQDYSWSFTTGNDTVPPKISSVTAKTTNTTATVSWTTSEQATNQILYGLTTDYEKSTSLNEPASNHSATLSNLEQGENYNYKILSKDALGNVNYLTGSFTTLGISNIQVSSVDNNSAVITWATNRNTDSYVEYGTSTSYGSLEGNNTPVISHSIRLVNLSSGTDYNFRIKVSEGSGTSYSQNYSFKTTGEQSSESSSQSSTSSPTDSTNTPSPTTVSQTTQSTQQQGATTMRDTDTTDNPISEPSDFEEETTPSPTGVVAGAFSNTSNNLKVAVILIVVGALILTIVLYLSRGYWLKQVLWNISRVFKKFRR